uniref:Osteoglycin n=1 Tax=Oncorhynchus tshawytscha TaxID=74940 RepID=A0A8C8J4L9_ONCTS
MVCIPAAVCANPVKNYRKRMISVIANKECISGSWLFVSELPTCLLCVCRTGSVYCEEVSPEMTAVPSLRIDLTGNLISEIEDGAFSKLALLEELNISELAKNPCYLPNSSCKHTTNIFSLKLTKMAFLYIGNNELETTPLPESLHIVHYMPTSVFQGNNTQYIRANMEEVRLDSNPLMLAKHPNSFVCLRALPIGPYH